MKNLKINASYNIVLLSLLSLIIILLNNVIVVAAVRGGEYLFKNDPIIKEYLGSNDDNDRYTSDFRLASRPKVILFYTPSCVHCHSFKPMYIDVASQIQHIDFYAVSCAEHISMCKSRSIHEYPSVYLMGVGDGIDDTWSRAIQVNLKDGHFSKVLIERILGQKPILINSNFAGVAKHKSASDEDVVVRKITASGETILITIPPENKTAGEKNSADEGMVQSVDHRSDKFNDDEQEAILTTNPDSVTVINNNDRYSGEEL